MIRRACPLIALGALIGVTGYLDLPATETTARIVAERDAQVSIMTRSTPLTSASSCAGTACAQQTGSRLPTHR